MAKALRRFLAFAISTLRRLRRRRRRMLFQVALHSEGHTRRDTQIALQWSRHSAMRNRSDGYATMRGKITILFTLAAFGHIACAGEIYRCTAANGDLTFTNVACPSNTQVQHVSSYDAVPDSPTQTWQAASEAAAISARQAREAAQQAQIAAQQAQAAAYQYAQTDYQPSQSLNSDVYPFALPAIYLPRASRFSGPRGAQRVMVRRSTSRPLTGSHHATTGRRLVVFARHHR
ncbi:MAG: DUF4124 domain-containing protein [Rudaea sp.]